MERQANIQLLNSKMAELEVPANDMLWNKIEVQLDLTPQAGEISNSSAETIHSSTIIKIIIAASITACIIVIGWLFLQLQKPKREDPPKNEKINSVILPAEKIIMDVTPIQKENKITDSFKSSLHQPIGVIKDTFENRLVTTDFAIKEKVMDFGITIPPMLADSFVRTPSLLVSPLDSNKITQPPVRQQDDYYFDVQKKKKKGKMGKND